MSKESSEVLCHTAGRLFTNREIKLSAFKSDADYTVKVSLDCEYSNGRYTVKPFAEGGVLKGANDAVRAYVRFNYCVYGEALRG
ncbi:MAG: hypothetical protein IJY65_05305 [Clostridia bacterium]|nr:hypothetical protein [Clostridia bacterium]